MTLPRRLSAVLIATLVFLPSILRGEPRISEFLASNAAFGNDEDNQASDWIEIHNPEDEPVEMSGYHLTDDPDNLTRWTFPERTLPGKSYLIVWASGKDRVGDELHANFGLSASGEYLALVAPDGATVLSEFSPTFSVQAVDISYGVGFATTEQTLITEGADGRWRVPSGPVEGWAGAEFDDAAWTAAKSGIGFGYGDLVGEGGDVQSEMQVKNGSVYVRFPFEVSNADDVVSMTLQMKFEDGFVAYLNGTEVASENAPLNNSWDSVSTVSRRDAEAEVFEDYDISFGGRLREGTNVFAIQAMNVSIGGSDLLALPELSARFRQGEETSGYLPEPTRGSVNGTTFATLPVPPAFSVGRGFYDEPFELTLSKEDAGATIRYTLDGKPPTPIRGEIYTRPINISETTPVRAVLVRDGEVASPASTHTYIFVDDVVEQSVFYGRWNREIVNHETYGPLLKDSIRSLPVVCLASDFRLPSASEKVTSIELFDPEGREPGFQLDCGIKLVGGASVGSQKNNFRLYFRSRYGYSKLRYPLFEGHPYSNGPAEQFDILQLRSGSHDNFFWLARPGNPGVGNRHGDAQYIRNRWIHDMQLLMGHETAHGRFVQLFVNGRYHGLYHFHERPMPNFHASYLGGEAEDYHYTNSARTGSDHGGGDRWSQTWNAVKSSARSDYESAKSMIDVENLADYMLLNFYAGNTWDWSAQHNWMAGGPKDPDRGGWKFYCWDSDIILQDVRNNPITKNVPDGVFQQLLKHDDFRVLFRDRVYKFCFNDGVLTPDRVAEAYNYRMEEIFLPIVAETARWQPVAAKRLPWDRDGEWTDEWDHFREVWFPQRTGLLLDQLRKTRLRGSPLYPIEAPEFRQRGGAVDAGYVPGLSSEEGSIYYTLDGSDPRLSGGEISPSARPFAGGKLPVSFVERGAEWKFSDTGEDLETAWREPAYDDSNWVAGRAQLGYGEGDEVTVVGSGPDPRLKSPTTYFRLGFDVTDASAVTDLSLELLRDDGAAVYLNGVEIVRDNLPEGAVTFDSLAIDGASSSTESTFFAFDIAPESLVDGRNILAVEVHQNSLGSSDLSFDFGLSGRQLSGAADIIINEPTLIRMRALDGEEWSGINEALFTLTGTLLAGADNLIISEIHYNPSGDDASAAEFLEFKNTSDAPVDLSNVAISNGVRFVFPVLTILPPRGLIVVTGDVANFDLLYADRDVSVAGQWDGSLSNGGERIVANLPDGTPILDFEYGDGGTWPNPADGDGSSLELADAAAAPGGFAERSAWLADPANWQASAADNGSPGLPSRTSGYDDWAAIVFPSDSSSESIHPNADHDGDGHSNFIEFAFYGIATVPDVSGILAATATESGGVAITFPARPAASGLRYLPQWTADLQNWKDAAPLVDSSVDKARVDGTILRTLTFLPIEAESTRYFRIEVR